MKVAVTTCEPGDTGKLFLPPAGPVSRMFFKVKKKMFFKHFWWSPNVWFTNRIVQVCKQCGFLNGFGFLVFLHFSDDLL